MIFKKELERRRAELAESLGKKTEEIRKINQGADSAKNKRELIIPILVDMEMTEKSIAGIDKCMSGNGVRLVATLIMEGKVFDLMVCDYTPPILVENQDESIIIVSQEGPLVKAIQEKGPGDIVLFDAPGGEKKIEIIDMYTP